MEFDECLQLLQKCDIKNNEVLPILEIGLMGSLDLNEETYNTLLKQYIAKCKYDALEGKDITNRVKLREVADGVT